MTLAERIDKFPTVKRANCRLCGNPWFFDSPTRYTCTTCYGNEWKNPAEPKFCAECNDPRLYETITPFRCPAGCDDPEPPSFSVPRCEHGVAKDSACMICDGTMGAA